MWLGNVSLIAVTVSHCLRYAITANNEMYHCSGQWFLAHDDCYKLLFAASSGKCPCQHWNLAMRFWHTCATCLIFMELPETSRKISSQTFTKKVKSHLNEDFSYIFYTLFIKLPEIKGKSRCPFKTYHMYVLEAMQQSLLAVNMNASLLANARNKFCTFSWVFQNLIDILWIWTFCSPNV